MQQSVSSIPKVSIIVPVYNAGPYLSKRLDTLIKQTLQEIEIILVLDCPTDGSDKIAESYAQKDKRIILIRNPQNLHVGLSRNAGLKQARGEYILFSDHDDYSTLDMCEKLYQKAIETEAEAVVSDYYIKTYKGNLIFKGIPLEISSLDFVDQTFSCLIGNTSRKNNRRSITSTEYIWNHLYKREFLEKHQIYFEDNRKITFEDRIFLIEVYRSVKKLALLPEAFYYHIWYPQSTGANYTYKSTPIIINYLHFLHRYLSDHSLLEKEYPHFLNAVLSLNYGAFRNELRNKPFREALKQQKLVRKDPILQQALKSFFRLKNLRYLKNYRITKLIYLLLMTLCTSKITHLPISHQLPDR